MGRNIPENTAAYLCLWSKNLQSIRNSEPFSAPETE